MSLSRLLSPRVLAITLLAACVAGAAAAYAARPASPGLPLRSITAAHPLRLLVTGDSLPGFLGPQLIDAASALGPVTGFVDVHNGTGLTRPDFFDWSLTAQQQMVTYSPDAIVVWIGGNDFQNMTLPNGAFFQAGTSAWTQEYQRRAEACMRIWAQGGKRRVYWLSMPPARRPDWAYDDAQINVALQAAAAQVPGVEYLDILGPITDHGKYTDYIYQNGAPLLIRESDGVHVNVPGSLIVAHEVLPVIAHEWGLGAPAPAQARPVSAAPSVVTTAPVLLTATRRPGPTTSVLHARNRILYCWVRNDALPPGTTTLTFRWTQDRPFRVVDQFPVTRTGGAYTEAYDNAVDSIPGPYTCTVLVGHHVVGAVHFTIIK